MPRRHNPHTPARTRLRGRVEMKRRDPSSSVCHGVPLRWIAVRSREEWAFRIRQELANLASGFSVTPELPEPPSPLPWLPAPPQIADEQIVALAEEIVRHRFPLFDSTLDTGAD